MSRFHDEFFRQGSPAHDALMIKSVSADGIQKILNEIDFSKQITQEMRSEIPKKCFICKLTTGGSACWPDAPIIRYKWENNKDIYYCERENDCLYRLICCLAETKKDDYKPIGKLVDATWRHQSTDILRYETEVIVRGGNGFILGYADAVVEILHKISIDGIIEEGWIEKDFDHVNINANILIEAKPKLDSIGEVIRQIKTYRDYLLRRSSINASVITTYSELSKDALEYLKNESIYVVVFEEGA